MIGNTVEEMKKELREWLCNNRYGEYKGVKITPETKLVSYTYVMSLIVFTRRNSTRYYIKDLEKGPALKAKILSILCTFLLGWWGIPFGPIWTIKYGISNIADANYNTWKEIAGDNESRYGNPTPAQIDAAISKLLNEKQPSTHTQKEKKKISDIIIYAAIGLIVLCALLYCATQGII